MKLCTTKTQLQLIKILAFLVYFRCLFVVLFIWFVICTGEWNRNACVHASKTHRHTRSSENERPGAVERVRKKEHFAYINNIFSLSIFVLESMVVLYLFFLSPSLWFFFHPFHRGFSTEAERIRAICSGKNVELLSSSTPPPPPPSSTMMLMLLLSWNESQCLLHSVCSQSNKNCVHILFYLFANTQNAL